MNLECLNISALAARGFHLQQTLTECVKISYMEKTFKEDNPRKSLEYGICRAREDFYPIYYPNLIDLWHEKGQEVRSPAAFCVIRVSLE